MTARAIVIGASAGGVQAVSELLCCLPAGFPVPILIVIHIPPTRENALVQVFQRQCALAVKEAEDKEPLRAATVYLAPPDYHLLVESREALSLAQDEPVHFSRPAIDVLFETAADAFGPDLTGMVLTGANQDGAQGLRCIGRRGGKAIVQRPATAIAEAMPAAALAAWPDASVLTLNEIANHLNEMAFQ